MQMQMKVLFSVYVTIEDQGKREDNQFLAVALASKFIAEDCQFDFVSGMIVPDDASIQVSFEQ